jgi:hypothetical protein
MERETISSALTAVRGKFLPNADYRRQPLLRRKCHGRGAAHYIAFETAISSTNDFEASSKKVILKDFQVEETRPDHPCSRCGFAPQRCVANMPRFCYLHQSLSHFKAFRENIEMQTGFGSCRSFSRSHLFVPTPAGFGRSI